MRAFPKDFDRLASDTWPLIRQQTVGEAGNSLPWSKRASLPDIDHGGSRQEKRNSGPEVIRITDKKVSLWGGVWYLPVMLSVIELSDVNGQPRAKLDLPSLKVGDPVALRFKLRRTNSSGRSEELTVDHRFRVEAVGYDASVAPTRQLLTASVALGKPPTWRSVKRAPGRRLGPARHPRTSI